MSPPAITVVVTTFQRPRNLERCLASLRRQRGIDGGMEVVVADDGSTDETPDIVAAFAAAADFPVAFTTHPHEGFHVARCRNEAFRASTAPYLLFVDGDCFLPPRHIARHLRHRRPRTVRFTEAVRLGRDVSEQVTVEGILAGRARPRVSLRERRLRVRLAVRAIRANLFGDPRRPFLIGHDMAMWRSDYEGVNGHDELFRGWGFEDIDLGKRLRRAGVRISTLLHRTQTFHLWHPPEPTRPEEGLPGVNWGYMRDEEHPVRCRVGLERLDDPGA